jgi:hypothetical protein
MFQELRFMQMVLVLGNYVYLSVTQHQSVFIKVLQRSAA